MTLWEGTRFTGRTVTAELTLHNPRHNNPPVMAKALDHWARQTLQSLAGALVIPMHYTKLTNWAEQANAPQVFRIALAPEPGALGLAQAIDAVGNRACASEPIEQAGGRCSVGAVTVAYGDLTVTFTPPAPR